MNGADSSGNFHDPETGQFVNIRTYVERIVEDQLKLIMRVFDEKDKSAEFQRSTLANALVEAKVTTERAMQEAKATTDKQQGEAKAAADQVTLTMGKRIELLESGGAPFASRLDESLTSLKADVEVLKVNMVRTTVLDALREQTTNDIKQQKRQVRYIAIGAGFSLFVSVILIVIQIVTKG
jgi:hypothetical protein